MPAEPRSDRPLRIGGVPYGVGAPLLEGLGAVAGVDFVRLPPRRLIADLRQGRLEAALASAIEAWRMPGYRLVPDLGIACDERVRSVRLFLRTEPGLVRTLAVDSGSATSVALSRIVLERRYGARLDRVFDVEPTLEPSRVDADAVLLIGDAGLGAHEGDRAVLDLGEEWWRWQRRPFVFALWLLRPPVAGSRDAAQDGRLRRLVAELHAAWQRGKAAKVADGTGGLIRYELSQGHREGLRVFIDEARAAGLCPPGVEPQWLDGEAATA